MCVYYYQAPRAGLSIPQWWVVGPDGVPTDHHSVDAARPRRAGRGRSGRKQCDR